MNERTLRLVSVSTPATRSSRIVVWNLRRIETTALASPASTRRRSPLVIVFWVTQSTTFSRIVVRALFGPRPVYSANSLTIRLLIAAASEPGARSCVSVLDTPASRLIPLFRAGRAQDRGNGENPRTASGTVNPSVSCRPSGSNADGGRVAGRRSSGPLVDQHGDALAHDLRVLEPQLAPVGLLLEGLLARPEEDREDHEVDLVDEVALDQLLDEPVAARHLQLAVELLLECAHRAGRVTAVEDRRVVPLRVLERRRDDELRHRVELVGELALALRPGAREALIGAPAEQQGVGLPRLVELELVAVVTTVELEGPAGVLEVRLASGRLHHAVERYELRHDDPCRHGSASSRGLVAQSQERCSRAVDQLVAPQDRSRLENSSHGRGGSGRRRLRDPQSVSPPAGSRAT